MDKMDLQGLGRVLVTGGTGFVGSYLVKRLVAEGLQVRVMDNNLRGDLGRLAGLEGSFEFAAGDICSYEQTLAATQGMDSVFHLAFINGTKNFYENPDKVLEVGVKGALHSLDAAMAAGVKNYFVTSSSEVYQQPTHLPTTENERIIIPDLMNPRYSYSGGKIITELLAIHYTKQSAMKVVIIRPHNFYGPDMGYGHVIPQFVMRLKELSGAASANSGGDQGADGASNGEAESAKDDGANRASDNSGAAIEFPIQGSGEEQRSFCYIDDAIDGLLLAACRGESKNIYHIGTEEVVSIAELAHLVAREMGLKIKLKPTELLEGGTSKRCPAIAKAQQLGYTPQVSLAQGVAKTVAWYRDRGAAQNPQQGILK